MGHWTEALHPRDGHGRFGHGDSWASALSDRIGRSIAPAPVATEAVPASKVKATEVEVGGRFRVPGLRQGDRALTPARWYKITSRKTDSRYGAARVEIQGVTDDGKQIEMSMSADSSFPHEYLPPGTKMTKAQYQETLPARLRSVTDPAKVKRMRRWRNDTLKPGRIKEVEYRTQRDYLIGVRSKEVAKLQREVDWYKGLLKQRGLKAADKRTFQANLQRTETDLHLEQQTLDYTRTSSDPHFDGPPQYGADAVSYRLAQQPDPKRPLAIYGDMLQIGGGGQHTYENVERLEQIPAVFHGAVARHIVQRETGGIWLGSRPVSDMDHSQDLRGVQPRGWGHGRSFDDVNGVYRSDKRVAIIGYTANSENRGTATASHEFGHVLADALGGADTGAVFHDLHRRVVAAAGPGLSPYYRQEGDAGPSEFFAEAFSVWSQPTDPGLDALETVLQPVRRLMDEFDIPATLATEVNQYFKDVAEHLHAEHGG